MMRDLRDASNLYKPGNYWQFYERTFLRQLRSQGLKDFRRRRDSVFTSMGATDLTPQMGEIDLGASRVFNNRVTRNIPGLDRMLGKASTFLNNVAPIRVKSEHFSLSYGVNVHMLRWTAFEIARAAAERATYSKPISDLQTAMTGNPEDVFEVEDRNYTLTTLQYFLHYAYCAETIDFDHVQVYVELGGGLGRQAEIIHRLHPNVSILLFDIPPQLYVCEQYLKAIFDDRVVSYRETRQMDQLPNPPEPGNIYLLSAAKFPLLDDIQIDLFWNAASLQEMKPEAVNNYLSYVNRRAEKAFLFQKTAANMAKESGKLGVLEQTTFHHYQKALSNLDLVEKRQARGVLGQPTSYFDSMWMRRKA